MYGSGELLVEVARVWPYDTSYGHVLLLKTAEMR